MYTTLKAVRPHASLTAAAEEPVFLSQPLCCPRVGACRSVLERNIEDDTSLVSTVLSGRGACTYESLRSLVRFLRP